MGTCFVYLCGQCWLLSSAKNFKKGIVLSDPISMVNWVEGNKMDDVTE